MRKTLLAAVVAAAPSLALAQEVPAIQLPGDSSAPVLPTASQGPVLPTAQTANAQQISVPPGLPPKVKLLSPSAELTSKERQGVALARHWAARPVMPHPGPDGVVRFLYGSTMSSVVCAPSHVCDLELEPGEVVNTIHVGDKEQWSIEPGLSGSGSELVTHVLIKPYDAGLRSNLVILTNRRTYSVNLVSEQTSWMQKVGFNYPGSEENQWDQYRAAVASRQGQGAVMAVTGAASANMQFYCLQPDGGKPSWFPTRAYTDGIKTFIDFPSQLPYLSAPALVELSGGGFFSSPTNIVVNYRQIGTRYVVDQVLDRAELVSGVGSDKQSVELHRGCN